MAINSLLKLVSNTTVVEAGTPQGTDYSISRSGEITQPALYRPLAL